jgi:hypothetical protein
MLQTSFSELKTHHPTNLYMLYPMMQSVFLVCVKKVKKMAPQGGMVHCHHPSSIFQKAKSFWHAGQACSTKI